MTRNSEQHISATIESLLQQSLEPLKLIVVNDGSSDHTSHILTEYCRRSREIEVINRPDRGYDIRRVPANVNLALASAQNLESDYVMISGDDSVYPPDYARSVIQGMNTGGEMVVASGSPTGSRQTREHTPSGSGRIIQTSFLRQVGFRFPVKAGWETWLLYQAAWKGYATKLMNNIPYSHVRPRGSKHQFTYWGAAMHTLGYHPLYAIGRIAKNLARDQSVRSSVGLLRGYVTAQIGSSDPFLKPFDQRFRRFVYGEQSQEITRLVSSQIKFS